MENLKRFRNPKQLALYHPPKVLPSWKKLPRETRQTVTDLLAIAIRDHLIRIKKIREKGGGTDER